MLRRRSLHILLVALGTCLCLAGCAQTATQQTPKPTATVPAANPQTYTITAPKDGKVLGLILEKGERISKGQPLFAIPEDSLKEQITKINTEIAKEEAKLKVMQTGIPSAAAVDISALNTAQAAAQQKATKMQNLFTQGAVSRMQAEQAQQELEQANQALQAASHQSISTKPASQAEQEVQQQKITALKAEQAKITQQLQRTEVNSPATCIVKEVNIKNGDTVKQGQVVMLLETAPE